PNRDGAITAAELPIALGFSLDYYAGTSRTVDLVDHGGVWDLSEERPDDQVIAIGPQALSDQYYAGSFPTGAFVVDAGSGLDAIYHQDDQALWLDGIASHVMSGGTLAPYAQPIAVLRFPITDGQMFESIGQ